MRPIQFGANNMKHEIRTRALKSLLLGGAALTMVGLSSAMSQDRSQMPGGQSPAAAKSKDNQPSARENRGQPTLRAQENNRSTTQGASPAAAQPKDAAPRATQNRDGETEAPKRNQAQEGDTKRDRNQARERDGKRDPERAQSRDSKGDRDQARERDTKRDSDQVRERDTKRDSDQTRERDTKRDREQAGERDSKPERSQARETDRRQDRDTTRTRERQVTEQQRTRISASIRQANVQPVRNVNFTVSVGSVVPASVRYYPVTPAIVEIYPEYRGYQFILVKEEIVIVEPRSRKIVTVIDSGGSGRAATRLQGKLSLTEKQRDAVRRTPCSDAINSSRTTTIEREYVIGEDLPETIEFETFPDTIYTEIPEIRSYRYVVRDDEVYVIDPSERRVIEIIR